MPYNPLSIITSFLLVIVFSFPVYAQSPVSENPFTIRLHVNDKDSSFDMGALKLKSTFNSEAEVFVYIGKLPAELYSKGYPAASVDSVWRTDNIFHVEAFLGAKYNIIDLNTSGIDTKAMEFSRFSGRKLKSPLTIAELANIQQRLLTYYERNGYPFASVYLDSIQIRNDSLAAALRVNKSVYYHVDSIRVFGNASISKRFLQRYLGIMNGSAYNREKLEKVDQLIANLPYVTQAQSSDVTMLGSGSVLNLYLNTKKSSQVNFLIGFLPNANKTGKLQLTGDVNLDLKNMLGSGESILVKWQQLQQKSPRLNLGFSQPYIFNSPFGFDFLFDLFKKDSSFLQLNARIGTRYYISSTQSGKLFVQFQSNNLLEGAVDTNLIRFEKKLPANIDVRSVNVGLTYDWINTNYRFNPRSGNEVSFTTAVGIKKIRRNNQITGLKDPVFNYAGLYDSVKPESYQMRVKLSAAHFFPMGKVSTLKMAVSSGVFLSPDIFRNELFQIGGYTLLRGFDEESIYATRYAVASAEYRILMSLNSYFFFFADAGLAKNKYQSVDNRNNFLGTGIGILYESKVGLLNFSFAIGKRNDVKFNLRESAKLHFGYISYF